MTILFLFALLLASPDSFDTMLREGLLALNRGDLQTAKQRLDEASRIRPDSGIAWAALAQTSLKLGDVTAADRAAQQASTVAGKNVGVLRALLIYYSGRGQPKPLIDIARRALALENKADLHNVLGEALIVEGDKKAGTEELRQSVKLAPAEEKFQFDLGQALLQEQKFDEASEALEAACKLHPRSAQLLLALGVSYYGQRRFAEAIDSFLRTIAIASEVEQPYIFLGKILDQAGKRLPEIRTRFEALLQKNPNDFMANYLLAKAILNEPEPNAAEAEKLLRISVTADAKFWESHFELGVLLAKNRKYDEAARELETAIAVSPKQPMPHYHLARVYDRLGKPEQAAEQRSLHSALDTGSAIK